jgi:phosphopantothenoylcysteine decarboxylase/phosphopantothenate--cysteine ligase
MAYLRRRRILLAVCGGIAAYKSAELVRLLQGEGASVRVLMTRGAREFITPLTLQALSGHPVHSELLDERAERGMGHIELARWADLLLIAPATADCLARLAQGRGDDLLGAVALATSAPLLLAPAMNQQMWANPATQANLATLASRGLHCIGPDSGAQACGETGPGRMSDPETITAAAAALFENGLLSGQRVVVTAGPTREALDPVRFITNHSSGRMGFALARAAIEAGAAVTLIAGPVQLETPRGALRVDVTTALDMYEASMASIDDCDIFIATAAVADYRPALVAAQKIKKSGDELTVQLTRNPDIVAAVASAPQAPFTVGFAAETERLREHAADKLKRKGLAMIVANEVAGSRGGFNTEDNAALLLWPGGEREIPLCSKDTLARHILEQIAALYRAPGSNSRTTRQRL